MNTCTRLFTEVRGKAADREGRVSLPLLLLALSSPPLVIPCSFHHTLMLLGYTRRTHVRGLSPPVSETP
jgi:hypothetical protein